MATTWQSKGRWPMFLLYSRCPFWHVTEPYASMQGSCFLPQDHCPMSTANIHIGSSCACGGGQSRFGLVLVNGLANQKQFWSAIQTNHITVSRCRHCYGEVVTHSTNSHVVLIAHLLSLSKIRAVLRAFYTMRYIDAGKGWLYF